MITTNTLEVIFFSKKKSRNYFVNRLLRCYFRSVEMLNKNVFFFGYIRCSFNLCNLLEHVMIKTGLTELWDSDTQND